MEAGVCRSQPERPAPGCNFSHQGAPESALGSRRRQAGGPRGPAPDQPIPSQPSQAPPMSCLALDL